jgi:hypothetical protein
MIASIFVLFVAAGITLASFVYGVGGVFPLLAALTMIALGFQSVPRLLQKLENEAT